MKLDNLLNDLDACENAKNWAKGKTWQEIYDTCHRGDWLLWLFKKTNPNDLQRITLAKGHCAATVVHLMKDERSKQAVKVAIAFGEGKATITELNIDADAAYADAAYAAGAGGAAAGSENEKATADICRQYLPIEIWNINIKL
jgi:hypothetical protein